MADTYEKDLSAKSSLTTSDYIRVVGTDNVSYKQSITSVMQTMGVNTGNTTTCTAVSSSLTFGSQNKVLVLDNRLVEVTVVFTLSASVTSGTTLFTVPKKMRIAGLFPCRLDNGTVYLIGSTSDETSNIAALQSTLPEGNYRTSFVYIASLNS